MINCGVVGSEYPLGQGECDLLTLDFFTAEDAEELHFAVNTSASFASSAVYPLFNVPTLQRVDAKRGFVS